MFDKILNALLLLLTLTFVDLVFLITLSLLDVVIAQSVSRTMLIVSIDMTWLQ